MALLRRCLKLAHSHAHGIERLGTHHAAESDNATTLAVAGAFAYFVDIVESSLVLIRTRRLAATFALSRVAILGLADLQNMKRDPDYVLRLDFGRVAQWRRFFDNAMRFPNPLVSNMAEQFDFATEAERLEAIQDETRDAGGSLAGDADRLRDAGFAHEHRSVYWLWSLYAHANLGAVFGSHVRDGPVFEFSPRSDPTAFVTAADGIITMTLGAIDAAFPVFGIATDSLASLRRLLSRIRASAGLADSL
jgi:hypothetical protein